MRQLYLVVDYNQVTMRQCFLNDLLNVNYVVLTRRWIRDYDVMTMMTYSLVPSC